MLRAPRATVTEDDSRPGYPASEYEGYEEEEQQEPDSDQQEQEEEQYGEEQYQDDREAEEQFFEDDEPQQENSYDESFDATDDQRYEDAENASRDDDFTAEPGETRIKGAYQPEPAQEYIEEEDSFRRPSAPHRPRRRWPRRLLLLFLLGGIGAGGWLWYTGQWQPLYEQISARLAPLIARFWPL